MRCIIFYYPLELFLCAQIDQGDRTEAKPSLVFPTAMVVKVKDAKTTRKQSKCSAYDNTKISPLDDVLFHVNFYFLLFPFSFVLLVIICAMH